MTVAVQGTQVACALCGASDTRRLYTKFGWGIERCRRCSLVYANPRAPAEAILARYSREYFWREYLPAVGAPEGRVDVTLYDKRYQPMFALIRQRAPGALRLLEVGSGAGLFLNAAARAGFDVAGLELSTEGAQFARDRFGLDVREERAEAMSFAAGSFDVAVMFDVIEHLFDPPVVLAGIRRALRPGGLLVISTPNFNALTRAALGHDWAVLSPLEHLYYFTENTLAGMLRACGFAAVTYTRSYDGHGVVETMNYRYTHLPRSPRVRLYGAFVRSAGRALLPLVKATGHGDALICAARSGGGTGATT